MYTFKLNGFATLERERGFRLKVRVLFCFVFCGGNEDLVGGEDEMAGFLCQMDDKERPLSGIFFFFFFISFFWS